MEIIVGREGQQKIKISDPTVSCKHCKITTNSDGTYKIEDLSKNGTYVNGIKIYQTQVTADTEIQLGLNFRITVKQLLAGIKIGPGSGPGSGSGSDSGSGSGSDSGSGSGSGSGKTVDPRQEEYEVKFRKLEEVYDKYSKDKIAIQKQAAKINFYRMLPMALLSLITLGSLAIPGLGSISPFIGLIGGGLVLYSIVKFYSSNTGNPEKIEALNKQFMIDYVCPKCGNFLGFIPYETLVNKSTCNYCKCKWS